MQEVVAWHGTAQDLAEVVDMTSPRREAQGPGTSCDRGSGRRHRFGGRSGASPGVDRGILLFLGT